VFARSVVLFLALTLTAAAAAAPAAHAPDDRELKAREAYAAGRYQEAVDLFSKLYAQTLHPTYLRNIGRCYQNLEQPDKAIKSYQEYLRKAKVSADERREVQGFITEMEALKQRQQAAPAPPARSAPAVALAPAPSPSADLAARAPGPVSASPPFYRRWWFWAGVGVVAAGVVAAALLARKDAGPSTDFGPYTPAWK
jgi:tetratricopeptide (TPR) repeat protein